MSLCGCLAVLACEEPTHAMCQFSSLMSQKLQVFWLQGYIQKDSSALTPNPFVFISLPISLCMLSWVSVPPSLSPSSQGHGGLVMGKRAWGPAVSVTRDTMRPSASPPGWGRVCPHWATALGTAVAPPDPAVNALDQMLTGPFHADICNLPWRGRVHTLCLFLFVLQHFLFSVISQCLSGTCHVPGTV